MKLATRNWIEVFRALNQRVDDSPFMRHTLAIHLCRLRDQCNEARRVARLLLFTFTFPLMLDD